MQIACGEKPPDALLNGGECTARCRHAASARCDGLKALSGHAGVEDIACMPQPVEDVDHLTEEELRRELRKARALPAA